MNTEQLRALLPCPFCGGAVDFHQDDAECRDGCHYIECKECGVFDLSATADPNNQIESLSDLRDRIAPLWNRRAAPQSQDAERMDWIEAIHGCEIIEFADGTWEVDVSDGPFGIGNSMREAIDHARRVEGEQ